MSLWLLFISAFISSTIFPGGSEAVLAYLASDTTHVLSLLLIVATVGNTLGGMSSWAVGWLIALRFPSDKLAKHSQQKAVARLQKYGSPILLFSWLPVIGDPLCVAAGWLRLAWLPSLFFIAIGKLLRYIVVLYFITSM